MAHALECSQDGDDDDEDDDEDGNPGGDVRAVQCCSSVPYERVPRWLGAGAGAGAALWTVCVGTAQDDDDEDDDDDDDDDEVHARTPARSGLPRQRV